MLDSNFDSMIDSRIAKRDAMVTASDCLRWARDALRDSSIDNDADAAVDAEALLRYVTGWSTTALIARARQPLAAAQVEALRAQVTRRARGEPVAYLTGAREFWSLRLRVTRDVLIPRAETELLVERALACCRNKDGVRILDLGTGSGAVALALASELPRCRIVATDVSRAAIAVARDNQRRIQSQCSQCSLAPIEFRVGDWFAPAAGERFDCIVANPPYIATDDPHLRRGDPRFEPRVALVAAQNGLADIVHIIAAARAHLNPGGALLLEHGATQASAVRAHLARYGFSGIETHRDLGGRERVTSGVAAATCAG